MIEDMIDVLHSKRRETLLRQVYTLMDADCSGSVDASEFENLTDGSEEDIARLATLYEYLDGGNGQGDGDGEISIEEWVEGMKAMAADMEDEDFDAELAKWSVNLAKNQRQV